MTIIRWLASPDIITDMYKKIAMDNLKIAEKQVNVKKGDRRYYTLLIFKDSNLQTIFNIGRHERSF